MTTIIRALVVVLTLTGAAASTQISSASSIAPMATIKKMSAAPRPLCPPDGSTDCGMSQ